MVKDIKEIFSNNLNKFMDIKGITVSELSERTGIAYSTVNDWKNGKKMARGGNLQKLSDFFGINISDLTSDEHDLREINNLTDIGETIKIPIIGQIACGDPITADENIIGYLEEPASTLSSGNLFALQTVGNSMTPTIPEGSNVIIREQPDVEDGEIAAVLVNSDEEATLKRVKRQGDVVMLLADNPAYPPYIVTEDNPARILGKAVKVSFDL